ncbi:hypothetical protein [Parafrankia sp. BMG5.11]|uniref:hypothetical protein n=1 Tax=Parafrankia sp. BMG5.11 TaxID=222540 RepID=UPI001A9CD608|nr:hypothetical protein [Parafrankia sp. BMG5.11]
MGGGAPVRVGRRVHGRGGREGMAGRGLGRWLAGPRRRRVGLSGVVAGSAVGSRREGPVVLLIVVAVLLLVVVAGWVRADRAAAHTRPGGDGFLHHPL